MPWATVRFQQAEKACDQDVARQQAAASAFVQQVHEITAARDCWLSGSRAVAAGSKARKAAADPASFVHLAATAVAIESC
jgi:hypothetical protein